MAQCILTRRGGDGRKALKILDSATGLDKTGGFKTVSSKAGTNKIEKLNNEYVISSVGGSGARGTDFIFSTNYEGIIICKATINSYNYNQSCIQNFNGAVSVNADNFSGKDIYFMLSGNNYFCYKMVSTGGTNKITIKEAWTIGELQ